MKNCRFWKTTVDRCSPKKVLSKIQRKTHVPEPLLKQSFRFEVINFVQNETLTYLFPVNFTRLFRTETYEGMINFHKWPFADVPWNRCFQNISKFSLPSYPSPQKNTCARVSLLIHIVEDLRSKTLLKNILEHFQATAKLNFLIFILCSFFQIYIR